VLPPSSRGNAVTCPRAKGAVTAWASVVAVRVLALTVALTTAGPAIAALLPLSASVIARANATDVALTNTNVKARASEASAVRTVA
jgi:hypothetical protein